MVSVFGFAFQLIYFFYCLPLMSRTDLHSWLRLEFLLIPVSVSFPVTSGCNSTLVTRSLGGSTLQAFSSLLLKMIPGLAYTIVSGRRLHSFVVHK